MARLLRRGEPLDAGLAARPAGRDRLLAILRVPLVALAGAAGGVAVELVGARIAGAGLAGLAGLGLLLRWWPASALAVLLVTAALNRFTVPGGGANIKPEHVAT